MIFPWLSYECNQKDFLSFFYTEHFKLQCTKMLKKLLSFVRQEDANFQIILWRNLPEDSVTEYSNVTVMWKITCVPFLAKRPLHQLSLDKKEQSASNSSTFLQ
ncbi:hypothetical protein NPIL_426781 [Nephila pilipes]|uniref:Uncharacterized protein n=1 Tax=Nephila pilipes TaxID=299642 RepID=A0A8X6UIZ4_NEPPI|nr:hypothetical protein NPIL_426781 [Nephila pilipes]